MKIIKRSISEELIKAARNFSAVIVTGPRRSGKTFLLKHVFKSHSYYLLEDPDLLARVKSDPRSWLAEIKLPAVLDEIQNAPELLQYIRSMVDADPRKKGQWIITGSQHFSLMKGVTESMAGRAAIFELLPFSFRELGKYDLIRGGFPEVVLHPKVREIWFRSYIQTYFERDVRALKTIRDIVTFRRFLSLLATRHGQVLNKTDMAGPLGISVPTITEWLSVLETTGHIIFVPPYFKNFGKRLIKSPKIYLLDPGLTCHLLGINNLRDLEGSPFSGVIAEGFIASELIKNQLNKGRAKELYFFRDEQGLEVDFLLPQGKGQIMLIEVKATRTVQPGMAKPIQRLSSAVKEKSMQAVLVHQKPKHGPKTNVLAPNIKAMTFEEFLWNYPV